MESRLTEANRLDYNRYTYAHGAHVPLHLPHVVVVSWERKTSTSRMQGQSHYSSEEAAVLGQLRQQKPSASTEESSLWNWMENEKETKFAPVLERIRSQEESIDMQESENSRTASLR